MKSSLLVPVLALLVLSSCTGGDPTPVTQIETLQIPLAKLVKEAAPTSHASQSFAVGGSKGMTKEYGYPFHQMTYDARIVLNDQETDGFLLNLSEGIESIIEGDGLRITGRSAADEYRGYLYHGNGKRGTLDLFTILDAEQATRILILVTEQPYTG